MDAKARKKILNFLKKDGGEQEVFDIAVAVKIDEDLVQAELEAMGSDGLAESRLNEKGTALWKAAEDAPAPKPARKKPAAEADLEDFEPKARRAAPADDEFDLESAAKPAPPPPAPPPIRAPKAPEPTFAPPPVPPPVRAPAPPAPAPAPAQTPAPAAELDVDDFEPKPKKEKKVRAPKTPEPDFDDFEPKPKKEKAVREKKEPDFDDFEPRPKKEKKVREKPDDDGDDLPGSPSGNPMATLNRPVPVLAGAAAAIVLVIILIIVAASGDGKARAEIAAAKAEIAELKAFQDSANGKIAGLEKSQKALQAEVRKLRTELNKRPPARPAAQANQPAGRQGQGARRR